MNFIRSLFGYQDQQEGNNPQSHEINGNAYQELTLIAEGGYGYIWRTLDINTKKIVILKKQLCQTEESIQETQNEMRLHKQLGTHPNIVKFHDGGMLTQRDKTYALSVMEFCDGGTLFELLYKNRENQLSEDQILYILKHLINGLKHMHQQTPPIAHRDFKVENILIQGRSFKLCDFGSSSDKAVHLGQVSKLEASRHEELFQKQTTQMYRPPEMTDIYLKLEVSEKVDIWMLGCVLYTMCFYVHPFLDASPLAIIQADYKIPKTHRYSEKMLSLIGFMLNPVPSLRPSILQVESLVQNHYKVKQIIPQQIINDEPPIKLVHTNTDDFDDFQSAPPDQTNNLMDF